MPSFREEDVKDPALTVCGQSVRKSLIQSQVRGGKFKSVSSWVRMPGRMVLKAEL